MSLNKGLVGHWTLDDADTSSGTLFGNSPYDRHVNLDGTEVTGESSPLGQAYDYTSANPSHLQSQFNISQPYTITAWSYATNVANGDWNTLTRGGDHHIILESSTGELGSYVGGFSGSGYDGTQLENRWAHIAALFNNGSTDFYVDGIFVGNNSNGADDYHDQIGGHSTSQEWGKLSDVRHYDRLLSDSEISTLYNMRSQRTHQTRGHIYESFENNSFGSRWDISNATLSSSRSYHGSYSFGSWNDGGIEATWTIEPNGYKRINSFEYVWKEDGSNTGHVVALNDANGNVVQESGTENPQWYLNDGSGGRFTPRSGNYNEWNRFKFDFNWGAGTYDYYMEETSSGESTSGTTDLEHNAGISYIRFSQGSSLNYYGSGNYCRFDDISIQ